MPSIPSNPAATPQTSQIKPQATISRRMSSGMPELPESSLSLFKRFLAASWAGDLGTGWTGRKWGGKGNNPTVHSS